MPDRSSIVKPSWRRLDNKCYTYFPAWAIMIIGMAEQIFGQREEPPDLYVDSVRIAFGAYGFVLELGVGGIADTPASEKPPTKRLALVRMSPQHALILSRLLERNVAIYQDRIGKINLPAEMYRDLELDPQ